MENTVLGVAGLGAERFFFTGEYSFLSICLILFGASAESTGSACPRGASL